MSEQESTKGQECWTGVERRHMPNCESHLDMVKSIAIIETTIVGLDKRINGSLAAIEKHMDQGIQWRIAIIGTAITLLIQFVLGISAISRYGKQIEINTKRLDVAEESMVKYAAWPIMEQNHTEIMERLVEKVEKMGERMAVMEQHIGLSERSKK